MELLVSSVIFAVVGTGSLLLLAVTNHQSNQNQRLQEQQFAISIDHSRIQAMNDRYTCASGSCVLDNSGAPPGENEYYPSGATAQTAFLTLCSNGKLVDDLITLIGKEATTTQMQSLGINRTVVKEAVGSPPTHRYTVSWSAAGARIRQATLVPTAAAWCP